VVTLRPGTAADACDATAVARRAKASWPYPAEWLERWTNALTIGAATLTGDRSIVAMHGSELAGVCVIDWNEHASIEHLWVDPRHQRHGIGTALLRRALALASRSGRRRVLVESDPFAECFYQRLGGVRIGDTPAPMPGAPDRLLPILEIDVAARMADPGFAIYERVLDTAEIVNAIEGLASSNVTRTKAGARHVLGIPAVRAVAEDERLVRLAEHFIGPGATPFRATVFDKSQTANWLVVWHQDTALPLAGRIERVEWGPWSTKSGVLYAHAPAWALERVVALRLHLDDSLATNGPLRVLPNTHRDGVLEGAEIDCRARELRAVDCLVPVGGVIAMRPLTLHASSKSTDARPRRVLHIEYADSLQLAPDVELAIT
jgi:GNAT superfamily N-acetyltransferase